MTDKRIPRKKRIVFWCTFVLLLVVLAAVGFLAYRFLRVDNIIVKGNKQLVTQEILSVVAVEPGTHVLEIDKQAIKQRLEENPFIETAAVEYVMPDTMIITIKEREIAAVLRQYDKTVCIDRDGLVLDIRTADDTQGVLVVKGVAVTGCTINQDIALVDDYQLEVLRLVLRALEVTDQCSSYSELDLTYSVDIWLTTPEGMEVRLGQAVDLEDKLLLVKDVRTQLNQEGVVTGSLSATNTTAVTYAPADLVIVEDESAWNGTEPDTGETSNNDDDTGADQPLDDVPGEVPEE